MHILVAFEEDYRVYQDVVADAISTLRPHVEVSVCELDALEAEISRLGPGVVICSLPKNAVNAAGGVPASLKLPTGYDRSAELYLDGEYSKMEDPGVNELLGVVDATEGLVQVKARILPV